MRKIKAIKSISNEPEVKPIAIVPERVMTYNVITALKLDELIVKANHWITLNGYEAIGGATFSDQLGIWTQTLIKKNKDC